MAIPKTGDVSLIAVRDDVGETGTFSMNSRAARDKLNWDSSERALTQYRGNILGCQTELELSNKDTLYTYQNGSFGTSYKGSEIGEPADADSQNVWPNEPRHTQYFQLEGSSISSSDTWSEHRHIGYFPGGGKLKWEVYAKGTGTGNWGFIQFTVVGNRDGFLSGPQVLLDTKTDASGAWRKTLGFNLNVNENRSYITIIIYCINKAGGPSGDRLIQQYTGVRAEIN